MPAPVVSRLNSVTYGGFAVGKATNYSLHGVTAIEQDYTALTVSFQVFVQSNTASTFNTLCTALEAAYRVPNGNLVVVLNSATWISLSQSANTGMNAIPSIRKAGGGGDSNLSRIYDCSVTVMRPADEASRAGRQSSQATLTEDGSEALHLDVSAVYTALSSNSALTQAQAQFPTYVGTLQSAAGGTWDESAAITYSHDSENKICRCRTSSRQILADQSQSGTNDTTLQGVWTEVTTDRVGIGADRGETNPLIKIAVRYSALVRSSVSTDLATVYTDNVRPHMIAIAQSHSLGTSTVTAILERPGLRRQDNSINARMVFLAPEGSSLIRADTNVAMVERMPFFFEPVLDGDDFSRDRHNRPGFKGAAVVSTVLMVGEGGEPGKRDATMTEMASYIAMLRRRDYHIIEKQEPVFKQIEFVGLSGTSKLNLISIRRTVIMEKARLRTLPGGGSMRTQTRGTGRIVGGTRSGSVLTNGVWID